ncbi:hypothetical protein ACVW0A_001121 [Pseudomonas sp. TE3610]
MLIILLTISLSHKHPHELLDSVVKERLVDSFVSTEARILRFPQSLSSVYFEVFQNFSLNFKHLARFDLSLAGGEFYSDLSRCQLPFLPLFDVKIETLQIQLLRLTR